MALLKALIINTEIMQAIPVMFNPPEYELQKTNQFAEIGIPGLGSSLLQFVKGSAQTLTMKLFFDTTDTGRDVRLYTELVMALTDIQVHTHAPPRLLFVWGSLVFPCVLERVSQTFDYFNAYGQPLRATLDVSLKGYDTIESLLSIRPLQSADHDKHRIVKEGDTLSSIAGQEYGDSKNWRPIAEMNQIENPLSLEVGQSLKIPKIE